MRTAFSTEQARQIGERIGIDFDIVSLDEFRRGLAIELEHGLHDPQTNVSNDNEDTTAKIAWAHLKEIPDYYTRLKKMESEADSRNKEPAMKQLYTSDNKKLFGVCGGIGEYYDIDPTLVRLGWIVLTVLTGVVPGVIGYVVAAIVIPSK